MTYRHLHRLILVPTFAAVLAGAYAQDTSRTSNSSSSSNSSNSSSSSSSSNTIAFSDPSKPGTVKISLGRGELRVQGTDTNEVTVKTEAKSTSSKPRKDGMRVISSASSFALSE